MEGLKRAKLKNKILDWLTCNHGAYSTDTIYKKMAKPVKSESHFNEIVSEMCNDGSKYFDYNDDGTWNFLSSNDFTQEFLDNGGFVNQYESDLEADLEATANSNQEGKIRDLQEENLTLSNQVAMMKIKTYWFPIIVSAIGALTAIGSLIYTINQATETVSKTELQELKNEVDSLRIEFKKENDDLKERLYEAELLIAVYEGDSVGDDTKNKD